MRDFGFSIDFLQYIPKKIHYPKKFIKRICDIQKCITFVIPTKKVGLI